MLYKLSNVIFIVEPAASDPDEIVLENVLETDEGLVACNVTCNAVVEKLAVAVP